MKTSKAPIIITAVILVLLFLVALNFNLNELSWIKNIIIIPAILIAAWIIFLNIKAIEHRHQDEIDKLNTRLTEKRVQITKQGSSIDLPVDVSYEKNKAREAIEEIKNELDKKNSLLSNDLKAINSVVSSLKAQVDIENQQEKDIKSIDTNHRIIEQNLAKAVSIANNLSTSAKQAFSVSENVQEYIKVVTGVLNNAREKSDHLFEQSKKISKIIEIISDISAKTHILSINASIVSARAGKDGKAFEVVSKEIRKLATETDRSLNEIEHEIKKIQEIIGHVVEGITIANEETGKENDLLTAVTGALQGVSLGVEVLRAVSTAANTKTTEQKDLIQAIIKLQYSFMDKLKSSIDINLSASGERLIVNEIKELDKVLETLTPGVSTKS